jgi:tRNA 5-methylaminomethyl-2-thiouridine biosynthesis bifunctional protein
LLEALAGTPGVQTQRAEVHRLRKQDEQWQALDAQGQVLAQAHYVVVASALDSFSILDRSDVLAKDCRLSKMHALAGEITFVPEDLLVGGPRCIVSGDGYVLPAQEGMSVIGSSYAHGAQEARTTPAGMLGNLEKAAGLLNQPHLPEVMDEQPLSGWAGWRAVLPARLPVIGPVPNSRGLWVACGFASRGLTWAPLAGDLIAAALNAEPLPLENDIIEAISAI